MKENNTVHIGITYLDGFPSEESIQELAEDIRKEELEVRLHKLENGVMASIEWIAPTAIAAYILKPYFDEFLKSAGKDHYDIIKKWLAKFLTHGASLNVRRITSDLSPNKIDNANTQSASVSIITQTKEGYNIKMLFDEKLSRDSWDKGLTNFLELIIDNHNNFPNDRLSKEIENLDKKYLYAVISNADGDIIFYDLKGIIMKSRNIS